MLFLFRAFWLASGIDFNSFFARHVLLGLRDSATLLATPTNGDQCTEGNSRGVKTCSIANTEVANFNDDHTVLFKYDQDYQDIPRCHTYITWKFFQLHRLWSIILEAWHVETCWNLQSLGPHGAPWATPSSLSPSEAKPWRIDGVVFDRLGQESIQTELANWQMDGIFANIKTWWKQQTQLLNIWWIH